MIENNVGHLEWYLVIRELLAESLLILNLYLFWSFASNVHLSDIKDWRTFRTDQSVTAQRLRAAAALATYFFGALLLRSWDSALYFSTNLNIHFNYPTAEWLKWLVTKSWLILLIAGAILIAGGLCIVRVFNRYNRANWILTVVAILCVFVPPLLFIAIHGVPPELFQ